MPQVSLIVNGQLPELKDDDVYRMQIKASGARCIISKKPARGSNWSDKKMFIGPMKIFDIRFDQDSKPTIYIQGNKLHKINPESIFRIYMKVPSGGQSEIWIKEKNKNWKKPALYAGNITQLDIQISPVPVPAGGEVDKFGVIKIYPDAQNQQVLYQGGNGWDRPEFSDHGYQSLPNNVRIKRKTFSFNTGQSELNKDIEVTGYIKIPRLNEEYGRYDGVGPCESGSGLSLKLRGSHHSNESEASAKCYIFHFEYEGSNCNNFQKEHPHPKYAKHTVDASFNAERWVDRWVGFKGITINEGNNSVRCEAYIDYGGVKDGRPANQWKKWYSVLDTGQFGKNNKPGTRPPYTEGHGTLVQFRMDNAPDNTEMKFASVRQIRKRS